MTGKRIKRESGGAFISSVRAALNLTDYHLKQYLFGLHLLDEMDQNTIAIVESEKTAVIMSLYQPQYLWLATGSKNGFMYAYLMPIRNKKIVAFPDKGEYLDWLDKANELNKIGFDISVSPILEDTELPSGSDLADIILNEPQDRRLHNPELYSYIQKKNVPAIVNSIAERVVNRWAINKPEIWDLIKKFDLQDHHGNEIRKIEENK